MSNVVIVAAPTAAAPASLEDYVAQNNLLEAGALRYQATRQYDIEHNKIPKGAVIQCGGAVFRATADEAITGTQSKYVKLEPVSSGTQLAPSYAADLIGVSWDEAYSGYYDTSGNLYLFDEALAVATGVLSQRRLEKSVDGSTASNVSGALVRRDSDGNIGITALTFGNGSSLGAGDTSTINQYWTVNAGATQTIPKGFFIIAQNTSVQDGISIECYDTVSETWRTVCFGGGFIYSDGTNTRVHNLAATAIDVYYTSV